jgi:uncharacterized phiE125 gp8 family phage protein
MSVPLSTIKSALKIEYADDDLELIRLRDAAAALIERETGLVMAPQDKVMYLASFTDTVIPFVPFTSIKYVKHTVDGVETTMASADYWLDLSEGPMPVIRFLESPAIDEGTNISATVSCGYQQLPNEIVHAIIALTGAWYNNPEAFQPIGLTAVPMSLQYIIESFRVRSFIR